MISSSNSLLQGKSALPCRARMLRVVQQAISNSDDEDHFDRITESDAEDAAPESLIIDTRDTDTINVE